MELGPGPILKPDPANRRPDEQVEGVKTSLASRVRGAFRVLTGSGAFMGPGQPLTPTADAPADATAGRRFDYEPGSNLNTTRRRGASPVTFEQLRALADGYDLLRTVLETRKDQLAKIDWTIQSRDESKPGRKVQAAIDFWRSPDKEHAWDEWVRMLLEELYVTDAATIYPRRTVGGDIYGFELIDGATINRLIDDYGRTPVAPDPAYQQILHGLPAVDYTRDELLYRPRNPRIWKLYGFGAVEQIITTVNIALRRQANQLSYYTDGNTGSLLFTSPEGWTPLQLKDAQTWWDTIINHGRDYRARFLPGGVKPYDTKEAALKDEFDEWLARIVCFAFSIEPTPFVKQTNRATAETSRQQSLEEGIAPVQRWVKARIDECLALQGWGDLEFAWAEETSIDPFVQAQINSLYVSERVLTVDEVRADLGREPLTPEQREELAPAPVAPPANDDAPVGATAQAEAAAKLAKAVKKKPGTPRKPGSLRY